MSTWINKIPLAAALLALAACLPVGSPEGGVSGAGGPPPVRMAIAGGGIVVAGPKGFCIDREASRDAGGKSGLSVLSSCRYLGGGAASAPSPEAAQGAVLTAAVAPAPGQILLGPSSPDLTRFFRSERGRAALSRAGRADTLRLLEAFSGEDVYLMYLSDRAPFRWGAVQAEYWRALLPLGGRMVTLAVLARPDAPLGRDEGLRLLEAFIATMRAATPPQASPEPVSSPPASPAPVAGPAAGPDGPSRRG